VETTEFLHAFREYVDTVFNEMAEYERSQREWIKSIIDARDRRIAARDGREHNVLLYCDYCRQLIPQTTLDMDNKSLFLLLDKHHANCHHAMMKSTT